MSLSAHDQDCKLEGTLKQKLLKADANLEKTGLGFLVQACDVNRVQLIAVQRKDLKDATVSTDLLVCQGNAVKRWIVGGDGVQRMACFGRMDTDTLETFDGALMHKVLVSQGLVASEGGFWSVAAGAE